LSEEISKESLQKSVKTVGELYPVLENQDGKILDGHHRLESNPKHHRKTVQTKNRAEEILVRLHAHHRRQVPQEETKALLVELAQELEKSGVPKENVTAELCKVVPFSERYVRLLLPQEYKQAGKVEVGRKGGQVSAELFHQNVKTQDRQQEPHKFLETPIQCASCHAITHLYPELYHEHEGKMYCEKCYPEAVKRKPVPKTPEPHTFKPKETAEHRIAIMHPAVSRMDEAVFLALQQNETLRNKGWQFMFQKRYCIKEVVSDITATKGIIEQPLFLDGEVHVGKEDRDTANRELLAKRLGIPEVLVFSYEGAYSDAKRDEITAKIVEALT